MEKNYHTEKEILDLILNDKPLDNSKYNWNFGKESIIDLATEKSSLHDEIRILKDKIKVINLKMRFIECNQVADFLEKNQSQFLSTTVPGFNRIVKKLRGGI